MNADMDIERAIASITEAAEQLQHGLTDVQTFKAATKTLEDSFKNNRDLSSVLKTALERFASAAQDLDSASKALSSKGIERFEKRLEGGLDEVRESSRLIKAEVQSVESSLTKEFIHLVEGMVKIETAFNTVRVSLSSLATSKEKSDEQVEARLKDLNKQLVEGMAKIETSFDTVRALLSSLGASIERSDQSIETRFIQLDKSIQTISMDMSQSIHTMSANVGKSMENMSGELTRSGQVLSAEAAANRKWLEEELVTLRKQAVIAFSAIGILLTAILIKTLLFR